MSNEVKLVSSNKLINSNIDLVLIGSVLIINIMLALKKFGTVYVYGMPLLFLPFIVCLFPYRKLINTDARIKMITYESGFAVLMLLIFVLTLACCWLNFFYVREYMIVLTIDLVIKNTFLGLGLVSFLFALFFAIFKRRHQYLLEK
ncbi:MAG TPA: hypothetical protein PLZ08_04655 [Bacillota bacterium]|jgi:hypothetical protein|nr:hypothetical protein [Bacillota bacterium]HOL10751.1 hypothetical protein [Bacillota bacterium]HPO97232.1 hypothetical protein [Bacillota bacterium]